MGAANRERGVLGRSAGADGGQQQHHSGAYACPAQGHTQYKDAEQNYISDLLNLVVVKGYLNKLLTNAAVVDYIGRHEP